VYTLRKYTLLPNDFIGEEHHLCAKSQHTNDWEKTYSFLRESLMLETRGSKNLVTIVNSVCSLKEYCIPHSVFLDEQYHHYVESNHSSEREKHCSSCKRSINIKSNRVLYLVEHGELSFF
jgi:hypothetical protein